MNQFQQRIAFFAEHEGGLHILDPVTGNIERIDVGFWDVGDLAYSPTARLLAFEASSSHTTPPSLYLLGYEDSGPTLVFQSTEDVFLYRPEFDPAGRYLYAVNVLSGIHRFSLADSLWTLVHVNGAPGLQPQRISISPSGERVAISPRRYDGFLIGRINDSGFAIEHHLLKEYESCYSPRWVSEDRIVFAGRLSPGIEQIWALDLVSEEVAQLTYDPVATRGHLSLSPDRQEIVFTATNRHQPLEWRLWRINIDGSGLQQLTRGGSLSSHLSPVFIDW